MSKTREQIEAQLEENIPREAIATRSAGAGRSLDYLASWYVIDRMNKVFGPMGWDCETVSMQQVGTPECARYVAKVRITASVRENDSEGNLIGYTKVIREGTGWGSDKPRRDGSVESPHEMASKEAESDALKRAAMKLGISMGLGLYDKSGSFIDEAETPAQAPAAKQEAFNRDSLNKRISTMSQVVIAKRVKTLDQLKADMREKYSVDATKELSDTQAKELLNTLETLANG